MWRESILKKKNNRVCMGGGEGGIALRFYRSLEKKMLTRFLFFARYAELLGSRRLESGAPRVQTPIKIRIEQILNSYFGGTHGSGTQTASYILAFRGLTRQTGGMRP